MEDDEMDDYPSLLNLLWRFCDLCDWLESTGRAFLDDLIEHQVFVIALVWALLISVLVAPSYPPAGFLVPVTGFVFLIGYVIADTLDLKRRNGMLRDQDDRAREWESLVPTKEEPFPIDLTGTPEGFVLRLRSEDWLIAHRRREERTRLGHWTS